MPEEKNSVTSNLTNSPYVTLTGFNKNTNLETFSPKYKILS